MFTKDRIEICRLIGEFFLRENSNDYDKAEKQILQLDIKDVQPIQKIKVELGRPGLLIGRKSLLIHRLEEFIGMKIDIVEDRQSINSLIIPVDYSSGLFRIE